MNRQMLKRILALIAVLVLVCAMPGCSCKRDEAAEQPQDTQDASAEETDDTLKETEKAETEKETEKEIKRSGETKTESSAEKEENDPRRAVLDYYRDIFVVTTNLLNVRKEPSTEAPVVATIAKNGAGEVLDTTADGSWLRVRSGGVEGYVSSEFVATGNQAKSLAVENCTEGIQITENVVNVRRIADTHGEVLTKANEGEIYPNLGEAGEFYRTSIGGEDAYVHISCAQPVYFLQEAVPSGYTETAEDSLEGETDAEGSSLAEDNESSASSEAEASAATTTTAPTTRPASSGANGITVCIDPGHQQHGISEMEPNGPGSSVMKAKLTTGTAGVATGIPEYEINLQVSLRLQAELQARGYNVVMIRTTNNCPLSNAERAQVANNSGAQAFIRIHCNSVTDPSVTGTINYAPSPGNPYLSPGVINSSIILAQTLVNHMCAVTGALNRGVIQDDSMTGINWCRIPVTIVEMGFMSSPSEDQLLANPDYQYRLAVGMANGIDAYFGR